MVRLYSPEMHPHLELPVILSLTCFHCGNVMWIVVDTVLRLQTIKAIVDSHSFKSPKSDEPRRVQVLDLYCLTRFESESSSREIVY